MEWRWEWRWGSAATASIFVLARDDKPMADGTQPHAHP
jgi:hypothetical protein